MMTDLKFFIAAPMSSFNDSELYVRCRKGVLSLITALRDKNYIVFSELERFRDLKDYDEPASAVMEDLKKIAEYDVFVLFHPVKMQTSSLIELGYALAHNKRIFIISKKENLPYLALGLPVVFNNVFIFSVEELTDVIIQEIISYF